MTVKDAIPVMQSILTLKRTPITISNPDGMVIVEDTRGEVALAAIQASIPNEATVELLQGARA